jgi:hypothetical protein
MCVRRERFGENKPPRCPSCAEPCKLIGYKVPVPKKRDIRGWRALRKAMLENKRLRVEQRVQWTMWRRRQIFHQLRRLKTRPFNKERAKQITQLQEQLARL